MFTVVGTAAYFIAVQQWDPSEGESPPDAVQAVEKIGSPATPFQLSTYTEKDSTFDFGSLKGQPILLNFWATWCGPCIKEIPALIKIAQRYKSAGLRVVAVSVDTDWEDIDRFFTRYPDLQPARDEFVIMLDPQQLAARAYSVKRFPESYLIDRNFNIDSKFAGDQPWGAAHFEPYYDRILKQ